MHCYLSSTGEVYDVSIIAFNYCVDCKGSRCTGGIACFGSINDVEVGMGSQ
eukprot:XP_001704694.1 Hypothetical protein GL50803_39417 [Giardia lamblia ATCC 50803]